MYVTTSQAAALAGVRPDVIRKWAHRGYLKPVGRRGRENLYLVAQVDDVEAARVKSDRTGNAVRDDTPGDLTALRRD